MQPKLLNLHTYLRTWWLSEQHVVQGSSYGIDVALICDQMRSACQKLANLFAIILQAAVVLVRDVNKAATNLKLLW